MSHRFACVAATLLVATLLVACPPPAEPGADSAEAPTGLETEDQKTLYAIGQTLARGLASLGLNADELELVLLGLRDAMLGEEAQVDAREYAAQIREFTIARRTALAEAEKEASSVFVLEAAGAEGAEQLESGLVFRTVAEGDGDAPGRTDRVKVHYHGTLRDGTVFDSSVDRGEPAVFPLNRVIPCWTEALQKMKPGGKAHIVCPSDIAYGDRGSPPRIQPGAALAFEVELIEVVAAEPLPAGHPPTVPPG